MLYHGHHKHPGYRGSDSFLPRNASATTARLWAGPFLRLTAMG
jgi:hypothetical protein